MSELPDTFTGSQGWLRYDADTVGARTRLQRTEASLPEVREREHRWITFKILTSTARLVAQQAQRVHAVYRVDSSAQYCTCGLVQSPAVIDVLSTRGHLEPVTWEPTSLLIAQTLVGSASASRTWFAAARSAVGVLPHRSALETRGACSPATSTHRCKHRPHRTRRRSQCIPPTSPARPAEQHLPGPAPTPTATPSPRSTKPASTAPASPLTGTDSSTSGPKGTALIDLLQLTRIDSHGSEATLLLQVDERSLTPRQDGLNSQGQPVSSPLRITVHSDRPVHKFTATSLTSAITRTRRLAQVTGQAIHHYQRLAPDILSSDAVLSSLRPTGTAVDPDAWTQDVPAVFWPLEETSMRWSTAHRVTLDGDLVFVVRRSDDHLVVVPGADPQRPHESWSELFAWAWDSSDYSAVGMAGYGTEGLYLVRPGLLAVVSMSDESYEVTFHRASPRARPLTLIERYAGLLQPETVLPHLALAAHGCSAEDLRSGDALSTCLGTADAHRLLEAISKKQADTQTPHP